jgi:hypothetical protein
MGSITAHAQVFPALQCTRDVAVFPDEIMKGAQIEFVALLDARFSQEFCDLEFADSIGDGLTGANGEGDRFLARCHFGDQSRISVHCVCRAESMRLDGRRSVGYNARRNVARRRRESDQDFRAWRYAGRKRQFHG